jgi:hypothetical protein
MSDKFTSVKLQTIDENRVEYKVHGFWPLVIFVSRHRRHQSNTWTAVVLRWSSGGRDVSQVACDIEAAANFAAALQDAIEQAKLMEQTP